MIGAIVGDIVGSRFEFNNLRSKEFHLFTPQCFPTDDSIMSLAVAKALLDCDGDWKKLSENAIKRMQEYGKKYPDCGFGGMFRNWVVSPNPVPYSSYGNGSAMRVSPCAFASSSLIEAKKLSGYVTSVSHNHPEGLKGAEATVVAVFLARAGKSMKEIRSTITEKYYPIDFTLDMIRPKYEFDESCQGTIPVALQAFFESMDFEDAIRNAISVGGDSDTIAAITGAVAEAFYGVPDHIRQQAFTLLDPFEQSVLTEFEQRYC